MLGLIIYRLLWDKIKENIFYSPDPCPHLQNVGSVENGAQVAVKVMKKKYPIIMESNFDIALKLLECLKTFEDNGIISSQIPELFR
jgi:hypothetical protein